jgi:hypothetical protein
MASHFYTPTGDCITGLREARKQHALPSPTTILKSLTNPALQNYWRDQVFYATLNTPRDAADDDEVWQAKVYTAAEEHAEVARKIGSSFHEWAAAVHLSWPHRVPPLETMQQQCTTYTEWFHETVGNVVAQETVVVGDGYAGRFDVLVELKDGGHALLDPKTQALTTKRTKFNHYLSWALQLGAYAAAVERTLHIKIDRLISPCISSTAVEGFEPYVWPEAPSVYSSLFLGLQRIWEYENNYFPSRGWEEEVAVPQQQQKQVKTLPSYV